MNQRVFVVEDDELIRESLMELLEDHGYETLGAEHGKEALDKLHALGQPPCLIVLDLMMPVMDGREFRRHQLADPALSQIPIVVISAYRDLQEMVKDMQPVGTFGKPLKLQDLLDVIARHCCATATTS